MRVRVEGGGEGEGVRAWRTEKRRETERRSSEEEVERRERGGRRRRRWEEEVGTSTCGRERVEGERARVRV